MLPVISLLSIAQLESRDAALAVEPLVEHEANSRTVGGHELEMGGGGGGAPYCRRLDNLRRGTHPYTEKNRLKITKID